MSRITIHIGLHKTGTTFLQKELLKNIPETSVIRGWYSHRQLLNVNEDNNLIISDEGISGRLFHKEYLTDFYSNIKKIKKIYGNPKIIFGIRNQESFIASVYKQYLQEQRYGSFDTLFSLNNKGLRKHEDFLLVPKIKYLEENFSDVFIYSQESLLNRQNDFLYSLKEFLELKQDIKILEKRFNNVGIKTELQVNTLRRLNKISCKLKQIHPILSLYSVTFRKLKLTPRNICQYRLNNIKSKKFEIPKTSKDFIKNYYNRDWSKASESISY